MPTNKDDVAYIRDLAKLLKETELSEIEVTNGDKTVRVKRELTSGVPVAVPAAPAAAPAPVAVTAAAAPPAADAAGTLTSPMVGTTYLAPKPGDPAFVKIGDGVKEGQTVMIIEAMKVMNPIKAHRSGKIADILVRDAQPVEFGQALLVIS